MTDSLLSLHELHTYFRIDSGVVKAVSGVSLDIAAGETLGIVGESGSGKSVLCLSIMGLVPQPPAFFPGGRVVLEGREDLRQLTHRQLETIRGNDIAMIFQDPMTSLNPYLTIARQLTEVLEVHRRAPANVARDASIAMLERVGIPDADRRIDQYPHEFSGGMRQRVMIAMALLCEPKLLIADEPTTALDVTIQAQILELIQKLKEESNMAVILVTHDLGVVAGTTDSVAVMYAGRIVEQGPTEDVFAHPSHPYTRGLMRSVPRLDQDDGHRLQAIGGLPPDLSVLPSGCPFHCRCDLATDRCRREYPPVEQLRGNHWAACWEMEAAP